MTANQKTLWRLEETGDLGALRIGELLLWELEALQRGAARKGLDLGALPAPFSPQVSMPRLLESGSREAASAIVGFQFDAQLEETRHTKDPSKNYSVFSARVRGRMV